MKPLYVLVHHLTVEDSTFFSNDAKRVQKELERIMTPGQEEFIIHTRHPSEIAPEILNDPSMKDRQLLICGAYTGGDNFCVEKQRIALFEAHYNAEIYEKGTLPVHHK